MRHIGVWLLALLAGTAQAAGQTYMELVGELYANVEFPRIARDYCTVAQPAMAKDIGVQYKTWQTRNKAFLAESAEQFARANARLKPAGTSLQQTESRLKQQFQGVESLSFCRQYAYTVNERQKKLSTETAQLLAAVKQADAELTSRSAGK